MVSQWKRELLDNAAGLFEGSSGKAAQKSQEEIDTLYREIGKLGSALLVAFVALGGAGTAP